VAIIGRRAAALADAAGLAPSCATGGLTVLTAVFSPEERFLIFGYMKDLEVISGEEGSLR
jgi:hypothetical protein